MHIPHGDGLHTGVGLQKHESLGRVSDDLAGQQIRRTLNGDGPSRQHVIFLPFPQERRQILRLLPLAIEFLEGIAELRQEDFPGEVMSRMSFQRCCHRTQLRREILLQGIDIEPHAQYNAAASLRIGASRAFAEDSREFLSGKPEVVRPLQPNGQGRL